MEVLVVVDMQNDFIDGALGTPEAVEIVPRVLEKIRSFPGRIYATMDTHSPDYLQTQEGRNLPVEHCIRGTQGWQLQKEIGKLITDGIIEKPTFGSRQLGETLEALNREEPIERITLVGLCTDICVISNALTLKAFLPEVPIQVDAACCAGVSVATHNQALEAMKLCQIQVVA